ncbi:deoxyuridine 5'-triphosphate nucleotidohydrolase [Terfezia claveryi]|nr:deoxyuridine 5'-triphosphate nucleotidohydrolase [Terfezia claveryi]
MSDSAASIDVTSPSPTTTAQDTLPILDKAVEKRPSAHDFHHTPKKQKTDTVSSDHGDEAAQPQAAEEVDVTAAKITEIPNEQAPTLLVKLLSDKGRAPTRGSEFAAGYDVYSAQNTVIPAHGRALVDTDISIAVPAGTYGRIAPRSGLAVKNFIDVGAGVIDADYRGQVKILLFNHADVDFEVKEGDRVAQLILERIYTPEVVTVTELPASVRGAGGFGSTGGHASLN